MEDSIYKIEENINRIFLEIEENEDEVSEEQLKELEINQENLRKKLSDYNKAIQIYKNYNDGISNEIKRLQELKKVRTNRIEILKNRVKDAVIKFGNTGKSGNKVIELEDCKLFTRSTKVVTEYEDRLNILRIEVLQYCRELYKNDILNVGDDLDLIGLIDAINAKCKAERGDDFKPFTIEDYNIANIEFNFKLSLADLIRSNTYLLQSYYGLDYCTDINLSINKNTLKEFSNNPNTKENITIGILENKESICMK